MWTAQHSFAAFYKIGRLPYIFCNFYVVRKCMEKLRFSKSNKGLLRMLCTPDLVCSFFKLICYIFQRESDKYFQLAKLK